MHSASISTGERWSGLAVVPAVLTLTYPFWPPFSAGALWPTLLPQLAAYLCLGGWCFVNDRRLDRLFIPVRDLGRGLSAGAAIGLLTGLFNLWVIVKLTVWLGFGFEFLRDTPHARAPFSVMVPWGILSIAVLVELNFRGFIFGRILNLLGKRPFGTPIAVVVSAVIFSWDPFMVTVFRGYHWLALTDGLIWGALLFWTRNLLATVAAHAAEVILVYTALRFFYMD